MEKVLFLDIETNRTGDIQEYGAVFGRLELREQHPSTLERWLSEAELICGHNIYKHDIPLLRKKFGEELFEGKKIVDTLLWSALLFPENPYHKLVKGYKIINEAEANNPLSDCKLAKELLLDELNKFDSLDSKLKNVIACLCGNSVEFEGFLSLMNFKGNVSTLEEDIKILTKGLVCRSQNLAQLRDDHPVELAYALSLLSVRKDDSILPFWIKYSYPKVEGIIEQLRFTPCGNDDCKHCWESLNPKKGLLNYFGYSDFRVFEDGREVGLQEQTVHAGLSKRSFVAVFPTGGGKSLTYQLPALMIGSATRQLTVIISPLVSLMKDQVDNLETRFGIAKAVAINGLLSPLERQEAIERVETGKAHLLYLSPESLRSPTIFRLITSRSVARFVIDEAHCFSSWGQDFRVDYLFIAEFIKMLEKEKGETKIPVSCFTATAKPQVIQDIKSYFSDRLALRIEEFVTNKGRTNLSYNVINIDESKSKIMHLLSLLDMCEKPVIIYASRTRTVEEVCRLINEAGFNSTFFHGQLENDVKKSQMSAFMEGQKEIIVATSAFGMGVDKDDVQTVIHYNISDSLENYIQEAGRAGRSEDIEAKCYILFEEKDLNNHFSLLQQTKINKKEIEGVWKALKTQTKRRNKISRSALEIAKMAGWDTEIRDLETRVTTAISALEDQGFLHRKQNTPRVFADGLLVSNYTKGQKIILESQAIAEKEKEDCQRVLNRLIKDEDARVDYIADRCDISVRRVQSAIQILRDLKILGDTKDLTAFINLNRSKKGSRAIIAKYLKLERKLLEILNTKRTKISLRQLNQNLMDEDIKEASRDMILNILMYWDKRNFANKKRVDREKEVYEIVIPHRDLIDEDIKWRHELTGAVMNLLEKFYLRHKDLGYKEDVPVSFSLVELKESNSFMGQMAEENSKLYEKTLLFMNDIKAIKLEGGFMVTYNKLNLEDIDASRNRFTKDDYKTMETHYQHKTEQIHIVGEYAKKSVENYELALSYVNDYFTLDYGEFLSRYFPRRKEKIRQPITESRFIEIIKDLDTDQTQILNDNKSDIILVLAGPGSGKTKVLVHKIASLLLLEDVKPEQFLMLTFSKAAAMEFRYRVRKLVPEFASLIKITTFHGYCFELLGQLGDIEKSQNVIQDTVKAIKDEAIDITSIANKSVLLLDEVQDVNEIEWSLIETIFATSKNIRVIAVGDDDQNIYSFRGSSNEYMNRLRRDFNATVYSLMKNYRSRSGIIEFNSYILGKLDNRLKREELIPAKKTLKARLNVKRYVGKHLVKPMVEDLISKGLEGTKAILVRTNHQAILACSILEELGVKSRLLAGFDGFQTSMLTEIKEFSELLKEKVNSSGLIFENDWHEAVDIFRERFKSNPHIETCLDIISSFDKEYPTGKLLLEWYDYVREIRMEDAIHGNEQAVIVATMHKSKGKEFDHVWVLMEDYENSTAEAKRLVYVACSRAKASLIIHTNGNFFEGIQFEGLVCEQVSDETYPPRYYEVILGLKDVWLNFQKYPRASDVIKGLKTGDVLSDDMVRFGDDEVPVLSRYGTNIVFFSKSFVAQKFKLFRRAGFELACARVEYIVHWYDKEQEREYKIVLPRLKFEYKG